MEASYNVMYGNIRYIQINLNIINHLPLIYRFNHFANHVANKAIAVLLSVVDCGLVDSSLTSNMILATNYNTNYGNSVTLHCDAGYVLANSTEARAVCEETGTWLVTAVCIGEPRAVVQAC